MCTAGVTMRLPLLQGPPSPKPEVAGCALERALAGRGTALPTPQGVPRAAGRASPGSAHAGAAGGGAPTALERGRGGKRRGSRAARRAAAAQGAQACAGRASPVGSWRLEGPQRHPCARGRCPPESQQGPHPLAGAAPAEGASCALALCSELPGLACPSAKGTRSARQVMKAGSAHTP